MSSRNSGKKFLLAYVKCCYLKYPQCVQVLQMIEVTLFPLLALLIHIQNYNRFFKLRTMKVELQKYGWTWVNLSHIAVHLSLVTDGERDWSMHLEAVKAMLPLSYAVGHVNYAWDGLYYIWSMQSLPVSVSSYFLKEKHMIHHKLGVFYGMLMDMAIETSYIRFGQFFFRSSWTSVKIWSNESLHVQLEWMVRGFCYFGDYKRKGFWGLKIP